MRCLTNREDGEELIWYEKECLAFMCDIPYHDTEQTDNEQTRLYGSQASFF